MKPPDRVPDWVSRLVNITSLAPAVPAGVTAVKDTVLTKVTLVAATSPIFTVAPPVTVTAEPPGKGTKNIQAAVIARATEVSPGEWVRGGTYNDSRLAEQRQITCRELDAAEPDNPVIIQSDTGHQSVVNSWALTIGGIYRHTPDPPGSQGR
jgi:hypothetical protein